MKIVETRRTDKKDFEFLDNGALFRYEDEYYIKIDTTDTDGANAVFLNDGTTQFFNDYDEVEVIENYELVVNE